MDFVTSYFGKMNIWQVEHFFNIHICHPLWVGLLLHPANPPKSDDKYVEKVLNCSEVHLSELTCYKIHSLVFHEEKKSRMSNIIEKNLAKMDLELKRKSLEDLPEEIILKILGQVNIRDLIRCFFVNKKIRKIADIILYKKSTNILERFLLLVLWQVKHNMLKTFSFFFQRAPIFYYF